MATAVCVCRHALKSKIPVGQAPSAAPVWSASAAGQKGAAAKLQVRCSCLRTADFIAAISTLQDDTLHISNLASALQMRVLGDE